MIGAALLCKIAGHKRGKRVKVSAPDLPPVLRHDGEPPMLPTGAVRMIRCPRCGATWTRPVKARAKGKA